MKIVNRTTFMAMPKGTVFMFGPYPDDLLSVMSEGLCVKGNTVGNDFNYHPLVDIDVDDDMELIELSEQQIKKAIVDGQSDEIPADFRAGRRDGLFDDAALYLVFAETEVNTMAAILSAVPDER